MKNALVLKPSTRNVQPEPLELYPGDIVMWMGKPSEHSPCSRRVIYQVIDRKLPEEIGIPAVIVQIQYRLRVAFDMENPIGALGEPTPYMTSRDLKRLDLVDLGTLRLYFDTFIVEWNKQSSVPRPEEDHGTQSG